MEKNIYDRVIDKLLERRRLVNVKLSNQFKKQTPFGMEQLPDTEMEKIYDNMGEQDWYTALDKFGPEQVNAFKDKVQTIKLRRQKQWPLQGGLNG